MFTKRGVWLKTIAILTIPFLGLAVFASLGALDRVDKAQTASDELDGIFPFATVAAVEGALHEEGALAVALAAGLVEPDEFATATDATDQAQTELLDELTYHAADSPIGTALSAIESGLAGIDGTRIQLLDGTFDGPASDPYRDLLALTRGASRVTLSVLVSPSLGAATLANLDAARSAAGEAVFEATASVFEESGTERVSESLSRLRIADSMLHQTGSPELLASIDEALDSPEALLGAEGTTAIANGEVPDVVAWAEATVPWVLAYGDAEIAAIETSSQTMSVRAERAEDAVVQFIIAAVAAWIGLFIASLLVSRWIIAGSVAARSRRGVQTAVEVETPLAA